MTEIKTCANKLEPFCNLQIASMIIVVAGTVENWSLLEWGLRQDIAVLGIHSVHMTKETTCSARRADKQNALEEICEHVPYRYKERDKQAYILWNLGQIQRLTERRVTDIYVWEQNVLKIVKPFAIERYHSTRISNAQDELAIVHWYH